MHRLDKDTSGLIVVAKTDAAHWSLTRQLKERTVSKTYAALSTGLARDDDGSVDAPIGRNPGNRKKMAIVSNGRSALTHYHVTERFDGPLGRFTLMEAHPVTGRTHQIRVHMAHIGHALVGDSVYGKRSALVGRHFLHAMRLEFALPPDESERVTFEAPLPDDLADALERVAERPLEPASEPLGDKRLRVDDEEDVVEKDPDEDKDNQQRNRRCHPPPEASQEHYRPGNREGEGSPSHPCGCPYEDEESEQPRNSGVMRRALLPCRGSAIQYP